MRNLSSQQARGGKVALALLSCLLCQQPLSATTSLQGTTGGNSDAFTLQQPKRQNVSGIVKDARTGEPVMGVSVRVIGQKGVSMTDAQGRYSITAPEGGTLQFNYIGYKVETVTVTPGQNVFNVNMREDENTLSEAVVVGYGTQKKVNLTGSVATMDAKQLEERPIQNVQQGLQGTMPGVTISATNGAPGQDAGKIRVRGTGTFNTADPYILVDGVETANLSAIDPNDIESISVLKDAASAAIYGSKAANGVILITTKRGKTGKPKVTYNGYVSVQNVTNTIDRLSSYEYASLYNQALVSEGKSARFTDEELQKFKDGTDPDYPNTDWYDLAYKTGVMQRHNINVNGGTENVRYMGSIGYLKQTGVLPNAGREQFNGRTNLEMKITKKLTARLNLAYIKNNYTDASSSYYGNGNSDQLVRQLNVIAPWIVARYDDGTWGTISDGNPIAWLDNGIKSHTKNTNFTGLFGLDYEIIDGLKASMSASYVNNNRSYSFFNPYFRYNANKTTDPNNLTQTETKWDRSTFEALLNYDKTFGGVHNLKAMLGWHAESYNYKYTSVYRKSFPTNDLTDLNAGDVSTQTNSGYSRDLNMLSWFGRVNYDYAGKYLFEANIRGDGSSRFAKGHRWGYFPSFSAGWRISEEKFMENTRDWLSNLKLRASWGKLGNQDALSEYYPAINTYSLDASYPFGGSLNSGYYQSNYRIETITWEKATTWGIGLDMGFLKNRLNVSLDYYNRKTTDIIMEVDVPKEFALNAYYDNVGAMRNQGVELSVSYEDKIGDWTFGASANFAYNKSEILELTAGKDYISADSYGGRHAVGQGYHSYYLYKADGFFQSDEEAQAYMDYYWPSEGYNEKGKWVEDPKGSNPFSKDFKAGDLKYVDTNNDGKIDANDRVYYHGTEPDFTFGLNLHAGWKGLDVSLFFNGVANAYRTFDAYEVYGAFAGDAGHPATIWRDAWSETNTNASMPRIFTDQNSPSCWRNAASDFWLQNVSYLRLKNLQIGYTLPKTLLSRWGVENVRVYYSVENLFTIDNMKINVDPEATSNRLSSYPLLRTHAFGVTVSF